VITVIPAICADLDVAVLIAKGLVVEGLVSSWQLARDLRVVRDMNHITSSTTRALQSDGIDIHINMWTTSEDKIANIFHRAGFNTAKLARPEEK